MGVKLAGVYGFLCIFTMAVSLVGCNMKLHSTRFMAGPLTLFKMETSFLSVRVDGGAELLCRFSRNKKCKEELENGVPLLDAAQQFCASTVKLAFPEACAGYNTAYILGMVSVIAFSANGILLPVCIYLVYCYMDSPKHKPIYRQSSAAIHGISFLAVTVIFIVYLSSAQGGLDAVGQNLAEPIFTNASGASNGLFVIGASLLAQAVSLMMHCWLPVGDEPTEDEIAQTKLLKEEQMFQAETGQVPVHYGSTSYAGQASAGQAHTGYLHPGFAVQGSGGNGYPSPTVPPVGTPGW
eukprot:TRINITY_DN71333_c0_g1_i1.p1 TRINITY_DN71333_c0_g1~~TRINITY_DN71333_c0_g1_i1.p1  ORF type:complete len:295 (+),score=39.05 TRINITY_DN71333_c0_g1_i1:104-988(+)